MRPGTGIGLVAKRGAAKLKRPEAAPDYEPAHHDRKWYRSTKTGDRGYYFRRAGQDMIRYDRPMEVIEVPFNRGFWVADQESRPMTMAQVTQVAFDADNRLCKLLGMHEQARRQWLDLSDDDRIKWMDEGPSNSRMREDLYKAVMTVMKPLAE